MTRIATTALALLMGLAVTAAAPPAGAQTTGQAKRFGAAQKLFDQGAYTPAYEEFKALAAETGSPNAELYVARCLRELGHLPEAYEAMSAALKHATAKAESEAKYAATRNAAAADLALLEPKIAKLIVAVANPPAGLTVTLGGAPLANEKLGVPVAAAPGEAVVRLHAPGRPDAERRVTLRAGETATLTVTLDAAAADAPQVTVPAGPATTAPVTPEAPRGGGARIAGFVTLGVGVAGMATFATAGLMANHRYDTIRTACGATHCTDPSFTAQIDGGKRLDLIADVGLGVGIAGLATGTLLVILGGPKAAPPPVTGWTAPGGGGIALRGAF